MQTESFLPATPPESRQIDSPRDAPLPTRRKKHQNLETASLSSCGNAQTRIRVDSHAKARNARMYLHHSKNRKLNKRRTSARRRRARVSKLSAVDNRNSIPGSARSPRPIARKRHVSISRLRRASSRIRLLVSSIVTTGRML